MDYTIKRFHAGLINDFEYIYKATHENHFSKEWFYKKFDTKYAGAEDISFIAYSTDNEPAAFYGVFPTIGSRSGKTIRIAQSGETMTHPSHRNKGLFKALFFKTMELAKENGIEFFFGFPNKNSFPGFIKFGWTTPFNTKKYIVPVEETLITRIQKRFFPKLIIAKRRNAVSQLKIDKAEAIDIYQKNNNAPDILQINRNQEYIRYKSYSDNFFVRTASALLWIKIEENTLYIGDIVVLQLKGDFLEELKQLAKKLQLTSILFFASPAHQSPVAFNPFLIADDSMPFILYQLNSDMDPLAYPFIYTSADFDTF
ncbi:MAG TPA: GNAT family N-acetyltransferase [Bacteroidia bacterium]|jgi:GNAT superfamily N-acetyltransferase|nr:GNAT family N-acetyltransferase [Bacteroidia bacterium]